MEKRSNGCKVLSDTTESDGPVISLRWKIDTKANVLGFCPSFFTYSCMKLVDFTLELTDAPRPIHGYVAAGISDPDAGLFSSHPTDLWLIKPDTLQVVDSYFYLMKIREDSHQDFVGTPHVWVSAGWLTHQKSLPMNIRWHFHSSTVYKETCYCR